LALTFTTVATVTLLAAKAVGQDSTTATTATTTAPAAAQPAATTPAAQPAAASQAAPQLSYGVAEVVQLAHANVSEEVIVNYVQNSGNAYGLDANQILYLKQQGVSDRIVNTMLDQRSRLPAAQTVAPQNNPDNGNAQTATVVAQPTVTYAQPAQSSSVYIIPDTQTYNYYAYSYPYYYPYYGYYGWPAVSLSLGWGGYYGGYYGYHGGYYGGWHNGGGSWHNGGGGGSWHGGGGGGSSWHGGGGGGGGMHGGGGGGGGGGMHGGGGGHH
jgi:hypothetical protein